MPSTVARSLIVNMVVEDHEDGDGVRLGEQLARLVQAADAVAWPDSLAPAMAELRDAADNLAQLVEPVSASAAVSEDAPAEEA